jgi:uncharacterized coiled-coil DUF342 family protein
MECLTAKETIGQTYNTLSETSFKEKKNLRVPTQDEIDHFLDRILQLQRLLSQKTQKINEINDLLEKITWLNDLNDECLNKLNDLIGIAKDFHSTLIRQFTKLNVIRKNGIAKQQTKDLKVAIDNLRENIGDLESVFFLLPNFKEFSDTTKELSLL